MIQLMKNGKSEPETGKMTAVKVEVDDSLEEEHGPFHKRPKVYFPYFTIHINTSYVSFSVLVRTDKCF